MLIYLSQLVGGKNNHSPRPTGRMMMFTSCKAVQTHMPPSSLKLNLCLFVLIHKVPKKILSFPKKILSCFKFLFKLSQNTRSFVQITLIGHLIVSVSDEDLWSPRSELLIAAWGRSSVAIALCLLFVSCSIPDGFSVRKESEHIFKHAAGDVSYEH